MKYALMAREGDDAPLVPLDWQLLFLDHMQGHTRERPARALAVEPRRHGKDLVALHNLCTMAHERVGLYWHGLPTYEQARKSCWNAFRTDTGQRLMDNVFPREVVRRPKEYAPSGEMLVELRNGSIIQFVGSDEVDSIVGSGIMGLNASEFALWKPSAFDYISPMLEESGGWAAFLTTPRGHNHAWKMYERLKRDPTLGLLLHHDIYTAGRYTRAQADALIARERARGMLEELVRQEYLTSFTAALLGSYYGDLMEELELRGAMEPFEHERDHVFVTFDLGISDQTAIWAFRLVPGGVDYLAHFASHSKPISYYFAKLEEWERTLNFEYEAVLLPHDAKQRTVQTGVSVLDQFVEWARVHRRKGDFVRLVPSLSIEDGIMAARRLLQQEVRFHPRCAEGDGIEALRQYHREYDEDTKAFAKTPAHDWSSHSADSFRYSAVAVEMLRGYIKPKERKLVTGGGVGLPPLSRLFEERERGLRVGGGSRRRA